MAQFISQKFDKSSIKGGEKYAAGDKPSASQFNAIVEGLMFATENAGQGGEIDPELDKRLTKVEDAVADLTYVPIKINEFSADIGGRSTIEIEQLGSSFDVLSVNIEWQTNKTPQKLSLKNPSGDIEELAPSQGRYITRTIDAPSTPRTFTWSLSAAGEKSETATKYASIDIYNGVYYGAQGMSDIDSAFILGLTKELRNSHKSSFNAVAGGGEYIFYCIPVRFGTCKFRIGGFVGGFDAPKEVSFTNSLGYTENYYVYRSTNHNLGNTNVEVITNG